jgi:hypothetical protein
LGRSVQFALGRLLIESYSELAARPVPERFIKLIQALDRKAEST